LLHPASSAAPAARALSDRIFNIDAFHDIPPAEKPEGSLSSEI
jgi:hypothetical protein